MFVYGEATESIKFKNVFKGSMQNEGRLQYVLDSKNHRKLSNGKFYFIIKDIFMFFLYCSFSQNRKLLGCSIYPDLRKKSHKNPRHL